jgi:hypothetical protein
MMRKRLRECLFIACLFGLAILEYGWIIYPPLGVVADLGYGNDSRQNGPLLSQTLHITNQE